MAGTAVYAQGSGEPETPGAGRRQLQDSVVRGAVDGAARLPRSQA